MIDTNCLLEAISRWLFLKFSVSKRDNNNKKFVKLTFDKKKVFI